MMQHQTRWYGTSFPPWSFFSLTTAGLLIWLAANRPIDTERISEIQAHPTGISVAIGLDKTGLDVSVLELKSREWPWNPGASPLAATTWSVPAPPPPVIHAQPSEAPKPPPLTFRYLGSITLTDSDVLQEVLVGERVQTIKVGDKIDGQYEYLGVHGKSLVFMYLPLQIKQTLAVSGE